MALEMLKEDPEKQDLGSPCYIYKMCIYVKRVDTPEYHKQIKEIMETLYGPFPNPNQVSMDEVHAHWLGEFGVTGWDNMREEEDGELIPYEPKHCRGLFLNKEYWLSLNRLLIEHAKNFEHYLYDQAYEDAETLKKL